MPGCGGIAPCGSGSPYTVRSTPLGSPWVSLKRSYVHLRVTILLEEPRCAERPAGSWSAWADVPGVYLGGVLYRVLPLPTRTRYIGIARAQPAAPRAYLRPPGTPGLPGSPSAHPAPRTQYTGLRTNKGEIPANLS